MVERNKILCEECNVYIWYQNKAKHRETMKHKYNRYVNHDLFLIDGQQVNNIGDLVKRNESTQTDISHEPNEPKQLPKKSCFVTK